MGNLKGDEFLKVLRESACRIPETQFVGMFPYTCSSIQILMTISSLMAQWRGIQLPCDDTGSVLRSGGSPGEGNGNPPQYSCLGNPIDRGTWL